MVFALFYFFIFLIGQNINKTKYIVLKENLEKMEKQEVGKIINSLKTLDTFSSVPFCFCVVESIL